MAKILVIDDDKILREALKKGLSKEGWEVLESGSAEEGLEMAKSTHPDLIMLDILMPEVDGVTVLKELRNDPWGESAKVVFLTNLQDDKKVEEVKDIGVLGYFVKSNWKMEELVKIVRTYLS